MMKKKEYKMIMCIILLAGVLVCSILYKKIRFEWKEIDTMKYEKQGSFEVEEKSVQTKYPNPFIEQRADPQIYKHTDGYYYFTASVPEYDRIILRRAKRIIDLPNAEEIVIWTKHKKGEMSEHIWAPELHFIHGKWYIYFAAGKAEDIWAIRPYVLECEADNPLDGTWTEKGRIDVGVESFSLDATTFEHKGIDYLVWAQKDEANYSNLYIAKLKNPWTIEGTPVMLTTPEYDWEKVRHPVNEGPAVIKRNNKIFMTYSAAGTGKEYCIGLLVADEKSDLLDQASWQKSSYPILQSSDLDGEFGPGHNSFTVSEEGEDLLVYHARPYEGLIANNALSDPNRHTRIRRIYWNEDGSPNLKVKDEEALNLANQEVAAVINVKN
ncbi:glycoside hydrolase family 43 protein [Cellulosilyticum sp. I15G10I2]|uniref:glycoside hydrolase family 43 protein n=1 Tax=Cellulosilyticum sp. I15G10I2 TaxID=1892843 RepID=UPI00085BF347|nr:glycoside hydrolase family 43 protein [Cellulosilyticum sp. I15G10I2]